MAPYMEEQAASPPNNGYGRRNAHSQSNENLQDGASSAPLEPMAICGMALRLPGGVTSPEDFWNFLIEKRDARSRIPESRYNIAAYHSKTGKPGTIKTE